ncbi:alginate export family protein [Marinicaulis aureus]|uniref:Alginate export family protein n=1 Tax=Hyphococcus aureus TaxID=2666033 RepID=A0ABW1KXJ9_9PROT
MFFSVFSLRGAAVFILAALAAFPAAADEPSFLEKSLDTPDWLTIRGSHRTRFEVLDGPNVFSNNLFFSPYKDDAEVELNLSSAETTGVVSLQTSLFLEARFGRLRFGAELMDSRAYSPILEPPVCGVCIPIGDNSNLINVKTNTVEPLQSYIAIDFGADGDSTKNSLMLGRFTMHLGSGRLVGRSDFRNTVQSYFGAKSAFTLTRDDQLTLFYTLPYSTGIGVNNHIKYDKPDPDRHFWGLHYQTEQLFDSINTELFLYGRYGRRECGSRLSFNEISEPCSTRLSGLQYTPGIRISKEPAPESFDFDIEGAAQISNDVYRSSFFPKLGYFGHAEIGYLFDNTNNLRVSTMIDVASGWHKKRTPLSEIYPEFGEAATGSIYAPDASSPFDDLFGLTENDFGPDGLFDILNRSNILSPAVRVEVSPFNGAIDFQITYRAARALEPDYFSVIGFGETVEGILHSAIRSEWAHQVDASAAIWIVDGYIKLDIGGAFFTQNNSVENFLDETAAFPAVDPEREETFYGYSSLTFSF